MKIKNKLILSLGSLLLSSSLTAAELPIHYQAFAHNDYLNPKPLAGALENHFGAVEADVWLIRGELYLGHEKPEVPSPCTTLRAMYLEPLRQAIAENDGSVHKGAEQSFNLMIELKGSPDARLDSYKVLREQLAEYKDILTRVENNKVIEGPVNAVISGGHYPIEEMSSETVRYASIDGDMDFFLKNVPVEMMPWVSVPLEQALRREANRTLQEFSEMTEAEKQHAADFVKEINRQGRLARFYWTPETEEFWEWQKEIGLNFIATDELEELNEFLNRQG